MAKPPPPSDQLEKRVTALEAQMTALQQRVTDLEKRVTALEQASTPTVSDIITAGGSALVREKKT